MKRCINSLWRAASIKQMKSALLKSMKRNHLSSFKQKLKQMCKKWGCCLLIFFFSQIESIRDCFCVPPAQSAAGINNRSDLTVTSFTLLINKQEADMSSQLRGQTPPSTPLPPTRPSPRWPEFTMGTFALGDGCSSSSSITWDSFRAQRRKQHTNELQGCNKVRSHVHLVHVHILIETTVNSVWL